MSRKPYLIRTPNFDPTSGGIRVMWGLYGWLLSKGEIAYVNTQIDIPSVGIYPEIYRENDMNSETVVRWILQEPGIMGGPTIEEYRHDPIYQNDKFHIFSKVFDAQNDYKEDKVLFLPILNTKIFKVTNKGARKKTCFLVGKGKNQNKHPEGSIELTRQFAQDQQALADLLNECETLYCYDRLSAMLDIARLCGVKVKYYAELPKERLELYETGMNGLSYQDEDVKLDSEAFMTHYRGMVKDFSDKLDIFISETQK